MGLGYKSVRLYALEEKLNYDLERFRFWGISDSTKALQPYHLIPKTCHPTITFYPKSRVLQSHTSYYKDYHMSTSS